MSNIPTTPVNDAYVPGVCNINHAEIAYRRKAGHLGLAIFIVVLAALLALSLNRYIRVLLFLPAFLGAIGYLQAQQKFCVGYAGAGQQNASEDSKQASDIADKAAVATDKAKARKMNLQATGIALAVTVLALLIPA